MTRLLAAAAALSLLAAGAASAQMNKTVTVNTTAKMSPAKTSKTTASTKTTATTTKPTASLAAAGANTTGHSAVSVDCSKQADAKGLHGKDREKFRSTCKAAAKKG